MDDNIISRYTNQQAIDDGFKVQLGERLFATTNLCIRLAPAGRPDVAFNFEKLHAIVETILAKYNQKVYAEPPDADPYGEANHYFAVYRRENENVWAILDGDGLHLILPEDY